MAIIDVDSILAEVSPDAPCGEDLEYDPAFQEMERASQGAAEQEMGDSVIEAQEPDWSELKKKSLDVLGRSKDLRAAVYLTRALVRTNGFEGLHDGLAVVNGLVKMYWDGMHPELDPDDDNDPLMRVNTLEALADRDATVTAVREAALVKSRVLGAFGLRELDIATGAVSLPENFVGEPPTTALIDGAFSEVDLDELQATADAVNDSLALIDSLDANLATVMDMASTPSLDGLRSVLVEAQKQLNEQLLRRGVGVEMDEDGAVGGDGAVQRVAGDITNREDVVRMLDKINEFYRRSEPSSPVPILLERAKRLVSMDFMDIVRNLSPSGVHEIEALRGPEEES